MSIYLSIYPYLYVYTDIYTCLSAFLFFFESVLAYFPHGLSSSGVAARGKEPTEPGLEPTCI